MSEDSEDKEEPGFLDFFLASQHPFAAMSGLFGDGPKRAYEEMLPIHAGLAIIILVIALAACLIGSLVP